MDQQKKKTSENIRVILISVCRLSCGFSTADKSSNRHFVVELAAHEALINPLYLSVKYWALRQRQERLWTITVQLVGTSMKNIQHLFYDNKL